MGAAVEASSGPAGWRIQAAPYADFERGRGLNPFSLPPCRTLLFMLSCALCGACLFYRYGPVRCVCVFFLRFAWWEDEPFDLQDNVGKMNWEKVF